MGSANSEVKLAAISNNQGITDRICLFSHTQVIGSAMLVSTKGRQQASLKALPAVSPAPSSKSGWEATKEIVFAGFMTFLFPG